jgi:hypothetical protein
LEELAMEEALIVRGRYVDRTFIPDGPLPETEGMAELIITPTNRLPAVSLFDLIGKSSSLRSAEDIAAQLDAERAAWGES